MKPIYWKLKSAHLALYMGLGFALGHAGVSVMDKTFEFLVIMAIVVGIDVISANLEK